MMDNERFDPGLFEPRLNTFITRTPTPRQTAFLMLECLRRSTAVPAVAANPRHC
jgi:hypothetical protein